MPNKKINFKEKYSMFSKRWSHRVIAEMNDYQFKLAKIKGEFVWHDHKNTDETFIVIEGEMYVVPKGVEHKPCAENECKILVVEPRGVINTGEVDNELTMTDDLWI